MSNQKDSVVDGIPIDEFNWDSHFAKLGLNKVDAKELEFKSERIFNYGVPQSMYSPNREFYYCKTLDIGLETNGSHYNRRVLKDLEQEALDIMKVLVKEGEFDHNGCIDIFKDHGRLSRVLFDIANVGYFVNNDIKEAF